MTTSPDGDAMSVRFPREDDAEWLKREPVPWPLCWRLHQDDVDRTAAAGRHCETRGCREPVVMVTWRWWKSRAAWRVLLTEHEVCVDHGRTFASRHGIDIEPAPETPSASNANT